jgi:polysaccharide biosynthesis protein VpsM
MKMLNHGRVAAVLMALPATTLSAAPFVALGNSAELFLTASAGVKFDDNIYLRNAGEIDDMIFTFTPGVEMVFGRNAATSGNVYYRHDILRYSDNSNQDTDLANIGFNSTYNNGKTKMDFGVSYSETATNETSVPGFIVPRNLTATRLIGELGVTEKTTFGAGVRYDKTDYRLSGAFQDSGITTIPLDVYFEYSPKLQVSVGYRYRDTNLSRNAPAGVTVNSSDHFLNIGARGEFTPKLTGQIRVGYATRDLDMGKDENNFGLDANLTLAATIKTSVFFNLQNDFGTSGIGESTKATSVSVGASTRVDEQWALNANLAFRSVDYPTRVDDFFEVSGGVTYTYNAFFNVAGSISHRSNDSTTAVSEFSNTVLSLGANLRY